MKYLKVLLNIRGFLICLIITLISLSCASIPKQAPELSEELGIKISSIEKSHILLLNKFFNQKRELIDDFIIKEWMPIFAREFFNDANIQNAWDKIVTSNNKEERLQFILFLGPRLQSQINQKRLELIKPLDDLEEIMEKRIRTEYDIARSLNNSITSFLYSASKIDESRIKYMQMSGVTDGKIDEALSQTDDLVGGLLKIGNAALEKEGQIEKYLNKIKEIKESLKK